MVDKMGDHVQLLEIIAAKDAEILILRAQVAERDAIIRDITQSTVWKLTYPYRAGASAMKAVAKALALLIVDPRRFSILAIKKGAQFVRRRPNIRAGAHMLFVHFPQKWQRRLIAIAPPAQADLGHISVFGCSVKKEFLGEASWVFKSLVDVEGNQ